MLLVWKKGPFQGEIDISMLAVGPLSMFAKVFFSKTFHIMHGVVQPMKIQSALSSINKPIGFPLTKRQDLSKNVDDMILCIIQPSYSPWASPVTFIWYPSLILFFGASNKKSVNFSCTK